VAKLAPRDLAQVLSKLPKQDNPSIIVGYENADDAGVFRLNDEISLVQTVDFFTPVADDPVIYGRIAAVNSLNDVYAMGGTPLTALSIVCYPQKGDWEVLGKIMRGGHEAMAEENVAILGGHSIDDVEIKFGYAVTGTIGNHNVITNAGATPGDVLLLTKPIGTGVISTGIKYGKASKNAQDAALSAMTVSAKKAAELMVREKASGCTDVTGFGLLGHAYELAKASGVTLRIDSQSVPLFPEVRELVEQKMLTRGDKNNRDYVEDSVRFSGDVSATTQSILFDPQTAGGLLISISEEGAEKVRAELEGAEVIGRVVQREEPLIYVR
jgi:selenide,water dikinase